MKLDVGHPGRGLGRSALLALLLVPASASAQLTSDSVPLSRTIPAHEQIEAQMQSRFHLGPVRLLPQLLLIGPMYDNNVLGSDPKVSDWSLTVSAGLGVLIPLGKKVYLEGTLLPQYIWYDRLSDRRQWSGSYGGTLYAFFNKLNLEADYFDDRSPQYPNTEIQTQVLNDSHGGGLKLEVDLGGPWSIYANGQYQTEIYRPLGTPPPVIAGLLSFLNRNEGAARGGIRYHFTSYFSVGIGGEETRTRFDLDPERSDNDSTAVIFSVHYDRPRLFVNFSGGYRMGRPADGSNFPPYDTFTGSGYVSYQLAKSVDLNLYGSRAVYYGLFPNNPYYIGGIGGGGVTLHFGSRISLTGLGGYGTNSYPVPVDGVKRVDKVTTYGGALNFNVASQVTLTAQAVNTNYRSNIAVFDRSTFQFLTGLIIGVVSPSGGLVYPLGALFPAP